MNTQTFAQAQNIAPINIEELMAVNGGGSHRPFIGALQNLQMTDQADRHGLQCLVVFG